MKIFFYTSGCRVNQYETQYLKEAVCANGSFEVTGGIEEADVSVINSCTVTHGADADCRQVIRRVMRRNPKSRIIVTGCYAALPGNEIKKICPQAEVLADKDAVIKALKTRTVPVFPQFISAFEGHSKVFVKIQDGCDAFCSYCIVPLVRNRLWSRPAAEIIKEAGELIKNGYREIVLCGIRLGKYNPNENGGGGLTGLIKKLAAKYPELKISLSSIEIADIDSELAGLIAASGSIVRKLHIPLQSGDDKILRLMKRPYNSAEFLKKINLLRNKIPGLKITTDIMVGFPGETDKNFENTVKMVKKCGFEGLHVFRFSPRPGTAAEKMYRTVRPVIGSAELKRRAVVFK